MKTRVASLTLLPLFAEVSIFDREADDLPPVKYSDVREQAYTFSSAFIGFVTSSFKKNAVRGAFLLNELVTKPVGDQWHWWLLRATSCCST